MNNDVVMMVVAGKRGLTKRERERESIRLPIRVKGVRKMREPTMVKGILLNDPTCGS
jgi:hypothetical protein